MLQRAGVGVRAWALAALLVVGCSTGAATGPDRAQLQWLVDRAQLQDLLNRYLLAVDAIDRQALAKVFMPDAVLDVTFAGPETEPVHQEGFDAIFASMQEGLSGREVYGIPWHFVTSPRVAIDGDRGVVTAYMHNRTTAAGGTYHLDAVRSEDGWRVTRLHVDMVY